MEEWEGWVEVLLFDTDIDILWYSPVPCWCRVLTPLMSTCAVLWCSACPPHPPHTRPCTRHARAMHAHAAAAGTRMLLGRPLYENETGPEAGHGSGLGGFLRARSHQHSSSQARPGSRSRVGRKSHQGRRDKARSYSRQRSGGHPSSRGEGDDGEDVDAIAEGE